MDSSQKDNYSPSLKSTLSFILPSLLGLLLFVTPVKYEGNLTHLSSQFFQISWQQPSKLFASHNLPAYFKFFNLKFFFSFFKAFKNPSYFQKLFKLSLFWTLVRVLGGLIALCFFQARS